MSRVLSILDGNGKPGIIREFSDHKSAFDKFVGIWESREEDKKIYDDRQEKKFNSLISILGVLVAIGALIIGILTYEHETKHALLQSSGQTYYADTTLEGK